MREFNPNPQYKRTVEFVPVIDTREQKPYPLAGAVVDTLHHGDYSILGMEHLVTMERKSANDLHGSLTHGRARFRRECEALLKYQYAAIVVEADWQSLLRPVKNSNANPESIVASLFSWSVRFRLPVFFADDWQGGAKLVERLLNQAARLHQEGFFQGGRNVAEG